MKKVIISGVSHPCLQIYLLAKGCIVINQPSISRTELLTEIQDAIGLIVTTRVQVDKEIIDAAPNLQWIGRLGSGMEQIDVEYATAKGIQCISSPEGNCNAVAEHALGLLLNLMNKINSSHAALKGFNWTREESRGEELNGKTVGIIGFGHTGGAFAKLLSVFDTKVLAYDKYKTGFSKNHVYESTLDIIFEQADIVSLHIPLTQETKHLADDAFFNSFKNSIYFLNTCRGSVTDTAALLKAIESKKVKAAGLDVLENEKLDTYTESEKKLLHQLLAKQNVIITPHTAGVTVDAHYKMSKILSEKLPL